MTKKEYAEYTKAVQDFFETEGINNLTSVYTDEGPDTCQTCDCDIGPDSFFSWSSCDCCGSKLGGDREHAAGYNPKTKEIQCYDVCLDCVYYAEYGMLDDQTMLDIEDSDE